MVPWATRPDQTSGVSRADVLKSEGLDRTSEDVAEFPQGQVRLVGWDQVAS